MGGFYRMHRGWLDHPVFGKEPFDQRSAWAWLIERAAYKATQHRVGNRIVPVPRGSFMTTVRELGEQWRWPKSRVDRFLHVLAKQGMIALNAGQGKTTVTICNYDEYQTTRDTAGTELGQNWDTAGTQKKEGKEGKEEDLYETRAEKPAGPSVQDDFDVWYAGYPHKIGKQAAVKAFTSARRKAPLPVLQEGVRRYMRTKPPDQKWCNPATWLNEERWLDEPAKPPNGARHDQQSPGKTGRKSSVIDVFVGTEHQGIGEPDFFGAVGGMVRQ